MTALSPFEAVVGQHNVHDGLCSRHTEAAMITEIEVKFSSLCLLAMSRVEVVAALAPGVFPLLISAAERINDSFQLFRRYKNSARDIDIFQKLLYI